MESISPSVEVSAANVPAEPSRPPQGGSPSASNEAQVIPAPAVQMPPSSGQAVQRISAAAKAATTRGANQDSKPRPAEPFSDPEPSVTPVVLADLLDSLCKLFLAFLIIGVEQARAAALWTVHTYMMEAAHVSPIAIINAPEKACAKTLFQTILGRLVRRPLAAANASMSALFRAIDRWNVTLLIDEADTFFREQRDVHGMVNAGYQRGGVVIRSEASGDTYEPKPFPVFGPKSIAGIALERHLPDATMSRGIHFNMRRKRADEKVKRLREASESTFADLRGDLARVALDYIDEVKATRPPLPPELSDRAQDNWEPLLAIAKVAGPEWLTYATDAAVSMSATAKEPASTGNDLLADVREVLAGWKFPTIKTTDLIEKLVVDPDMGWATYNRGKPLTPRQLASQLSPYDIEPKTVRQPKCEIYPKGSTPKGYVVADFKDAFDRYLGGPKEAAEEVADTPQLAADGSELY